MFTGGGTGALGCGHRGTTPQLKGGVGGPRGISRPTGSEADNSICRLKGIPKRGLTGLCPQAVLTPLQALGHALQMEQHRGHITLQVRANPPLQMGSWRREGPSCEKEERCHEAERQLALPAGGCGHGLRWPDRSPHQHLEAGGDTNLTHCQGNGTRLEPESLLRLSFSQRPKFKLQNYFRSAILFNLQKPSAAQGVSACDAGL